MSEKKEDMFDKIMHLPVLRVFESFYKRQKEVLMYLFFGGIAFFLNIVLFVVLEDLYGLNELINNIICWIVCVLFQFITNRIWVFHGRVESVPAFLKQLISFFGGRVFTLVVEEFILAVCITWCGFHAVLVKLAAQVVVIVLNYIISKQVVFKEKGREDGKNGI